jgi:signal transduction histidine kinase
MGIPLRALILEDFEDDAELLLLSLRNSGYDVSSKRLQSARDMAKALAEEPWDIILSDFAMPNFNALDALAVLKESKLDIPFIVVSGTVGEETAVKTMRAGAQDYLMKGSLTRLAPVVQRELGDAAERKRQREIERELEEKNEQLIQSQKMEAIGSLAGGIAHDFNNMLGVIMLLCDAASEELDNLKSTIYYLNQINKAAEHSAMLTRQLLTYSRKHALNPGVVKLNDEIREVENILRRTVGEHILFDIKLSPEVGNILFDRSQIGQVVMNLTVNARDAMPRGGRLFIETRLDTTKVPRIVEGGTMPAGRYNVLSVRDTGPGMDEKTLSRIFEPYFTTKATGKGTGLGLPTVFGAAKQNGSHVVVHSALGKGTNFEIFIPMVKEPLEAASPPEIPSDVSGSETILVVEDQLHVRTTISASLAKRGYTVIEAENGRNALDVLRDHAGPLHLVVTDVVMPEMNGSELVEAVRQRFGGVKVIFMSGYLDESVLQQGVNPRHATAFLEKPFSSIALLQKIRATLNQ